MLNTDYFISTINQIYYTKHIIYLFQPFSRILRLWALSIL